MLKICSEGWRFREIVQVFESSCRTMYFLYGGSNRGIWNAHAASQDVRL